LCQDFELTNQKKSGPKKLKNIIKTPKKLISQTPAGALLKTYHHNACDHAGPQVPKHLQGPMPPGTLSDARWCSSPFRASNRSCNLLSNE
jgi:hypothetical protein